MEGQVSDSMAAMALFFYQRIMFDAMALVAPIVVLIKVIFKSGY